MFQKTCFKVDELTREQVDKGKNLVNLSLKPCQL